MEKGSSENVVSSDELHSSLLSELKKKSTVTELQPTLILERDSLGTSPRSPLLAGRHCVCPEGRETKEIEKEKR
jgi:hypothetical protein